MSAEETMQAESQLQEETDLEIEAEYMLETPVRCADCKADFDTVHVVRLLRTKTNFTSTLPRRGYMVVCPHCRSVLSAGLGSRMALV
jgi:hypothetical protein